MRETWACCMRFSQAAVATANADPGCAYEVDRREKSSLATGEHTLADIEQRIQILSNQFHILNNQLTAQQMATERQVQALESRLKELEDGLRVRRVQPGPATR